MDHVTPAPKNCKYSGDNCTGNDNIELLSLPKTAIDSILDHMDTNSLKKMRLVCKETKSWVDSRPSCLRRLQIVVKDKEHLELVMHSTVPWRNFYIHFYIPKKADGHSLIPFLTKFHLTMTCLKIRIEGLYQCRIEGVLLNILENVGPNLESLHVVTKFVLKSKSVDLPLVDNLDESKIVRDNLRGLRQLNLEFKNVNERAIKCSAQFLQLAMRVCPNLISLKVPIGFSFENAIRVNASNEARMDCESLIRFVKRISCRPKQNFPTDFLSSATPSINFDSDNDIFKASGPGVLYPFPLTTTTLLELVRFCQRTRCKLYNVPISAMPTSEAAQALTSQQLLCLNQSVASILSINHTNVGFHSHVHMPPTSTLRIQLSIGFDPGNEEATFDLPQSLNVSYISFSCCKTRTSAKAVDVACANLFGIYRPTVTEVRIAWQCLGNYTFDLGGLGKVFPNLRKFRIEVTNSAEGIPLDAMLHGLEELEELSVKWTTLDDKSLLGADSSSNKPPALLSLKKLIHLRLKNCSLAGITDACFQHLFPNMKLKTFVFSSVDTPQNVSFKHGISSLTSLETPFKDSIETFVCVIPTDSTGQEMSKSLQCFRYLKSSTLYTGE